MLYTKDTSEIMNIIEKMSNEEIKAILIFIEGMKVGISINKKPK